MPQITWIARRDDYGRTYIGHPSDPNLNYNGQEWITLPRNPKKPTPAPRYFVNLQDLLYHVRLWQLGPEAD